MGLQIRLLKTNSEDVLRRIFSLWELVSNLPPWVHDLAGSRQIQRLAQLQFKRCWLMSILLGRPLLYKGQV